MRRPHGLHSFCAKRTWRPGLASEQTREMGLPGSRQSHANASASARRRRQSGRRPRSATPSPINVSPKKLLGTPQWGFQPAVAPPLAGPNGCRFQPSGKRLQLFRQYNVSADTGAFEIPQSSSRLPDASTLQSVEVRPARKHLHAQPVPCVPVRAFLGWMRARAGTAVPIPSRARSLTDACITPLREGWSMSA